MVRYNQVLVQGFFNDVFAAVHTIECDYRCFYKCYFRGNCYGLSRCTAEDHASVCHVPHQPNSDFAVSELSKPTGATVVTEVSRPAKKNKSLEVSSHTNSTSTKSTRNSKVTTENSSWLTPK